ERYRKLLKKDGIIHLKTDDDILYEFSVESLQSFEHTNILYHNSDIYASPLYNADLEYKTYYEAQHLGKGRKIKYIKTQMS
ncbi:MAG TPA: tRNA (guanosine(46)-N7)-methyltransferase TrmB, partial [Saprospiraceae bacterium]|nr:tRNA (guanosine(46)-N7)-methyltransferase TrmB [Saprospiraceae bacterium]